MNLSFSTFTLKSCMMLVQSLCLVIPGFLQAEEKPTNVTNREIKVTSFVDLGQIRKGSVESTNGSGEVENLFLNRNGIALIYQGTVNEKLDMKIGVGGLFWKPYPEIEEGSKRIQFGPGIAEASAEYNFSENSSLKFGYFPYKYNPDAMNLGEYLLRSEAYPTILNTGGWVWMNSAAYQSMGVRMRWDLLDGALKQDFVLFSEYNETPIFDFTPAYLASFKVGPFEIGGGLSLHRWLPIQPSATTPNRTLNTYVEVDSFPAFPALNDTVQDLYQVGFNGGTLKAMEANVPGYTDSAGKNIATLKKDAQGRTFYLVNGTDSLYPRTRTKLTFKAIEVMGRASLDLGAMTGMDTERIGSFKIFTEIAVLGLEDQPYFYENVLNRIPIMVGVNLPTFGFLNLLSLQMEYFNNPWPSSKEMQYDKTMPIPTLPENNFALYQIEKAKGTYKNDDLKWTLYGKRTLVEGLDLYCQIANDHFRAMNGFARPTFKPITNSKSDWYYLVRLQWSM